MATKSAAKKAARPADAPETPPPAAPPAVPAPAPAPDRPTPAAKSPRVLFGFLPTPTTPRKES